MLVWCVLWVGVLAQGPPTGGRISLDPKTRRLVDEDGRERIVHGLNVVYKIPPYHPSVTSFDPRHSFMEQDAKQFAEWGMNGIRLGMMWPGVEPTRGAVNTSYLAVMHGIVKMCEAHGIHVLLDMHQDCWSEKFCGEGAPLWAVVPDAKLPAFPEPLHAPYHPNTSGIPSHTDCMKESWSSYQFTWALGSAVNRFWTNHDGIRDQWAMFWKRVATEWKDSPIVLGYELINEPWGGDVLTDPELLVPGVADKVHLQPAYDAVAAAIRSADPTGLIFFATVTYDDITVGFEHPPGGSNASDRSVLAYHVYIPPNLSPSIQMHTFRQAANRLGTGYFCTETGDWDFIRTVADQERQSWLFWDYKSFGDITGDGSGVYFNNGTLNMGTVSFLSRTYAQAIAGRSVSMTYDESTHRFELLYTTLSGCKLPTEIYLNAALHYKSGYTVHLSPPGVATSTAAGPNRVHIIHKPGTPDDVLLNVTIVPPV